MALYDANPLMQLFQHGVDNAQQVNEVRLQQPRPADVFLDRLRQAKQDQLHKAQIDLATMYKNAQAQNMKEQRLNQLLGLGSKYATPETAPALRQQISDLAGTDLSGAIPDTGSEAAKVGERQTYHEGILDAQGKRIDISSGEAKSKQDLRTAQGAKLTAETAEIPANAKAQRGEREAHANWYNNWAPTEINMAKLRVGQGGDVRQSPEYQKNYNKNLENLRKEASRVTSPYNGLADQEIQDLADKATMRGYTGGVQSLGGAPAINDSFTPEVKPGMDMGPAAPGAKEGQTGTYKGHRVKVVGGRFVAQ